MSQQLWRAIDLFAGPVVPSSKLNLIATDERVCTDARNYTVHADTLRTCAGNWGGAFACGGKRTGGKVMAMRAKRFRVKMTFLKRLRPEGARAARLVKTVTGPSLIYGSHVTPRHR